jgi:formamidopyrimidine-DNA glycosylase
VPELPEVETILRTLAPLVEGRSVVGVDVRCAVLRRPLTTDFAETLAGRTVVRLSRRAKYLLFALDDRRALIAHLGMSGRLLLLSAAEPLDLGKHDHVVIHLDDGARVVFNDPRRFGLLMIDDPETSPLLRGIGPEPFDAGRFDCDYLERWRRKTKRTVKDVLMDQHVVAGLGNIYVNEILFVAGIRPRRSFARLTRAELHLLVDATRQILTEAIEHRGSSISDFLDGIGRRGGYQWRRRVYDRAGEPCVRCHTAIKSVVVGQRSSFYCPNCQR